MCHPRSGGGGRGSIKKRRGRKCDTTLGFPPKKERKIWRENRILLARHTISHFFLFWGNILISYSCSFFCESVREGSSCQAHAIRLRGIDKDLDGHIFFANEVARASGGGEFQLNCFTGHRVAQKNLRKQKKYSMPKVYPTATKILRKSFVSFVLNFFSVKPNALSSSLLFCRRH